MSFDFNGKTVLITGASYGLGEQFAYVRCCCSKYDYNVCNWRIRNDTF